MSLIIEVIILAPFLTRVHFIVGEQYLVLLVLVQYLCYLYSTCVTCTVLVLLVQYLVLLVLVQYLCYLYSTCVTCTVLVLLVQYLVLLVLVQYLCYFWYYLYNYHIASGQMDVFVFQTSLLYDCLECFFWDRIPTMSGNL